MRTLLVAVAFVVGVTEVLPAQRSFAERRAEVLRVASGERDRGFATITAKLLTGQDLPFAFAMLDSLTYDQSIGGMFYAYTLIGCYLLGERVLPDTLKRKMREAYRVRTMYRGDTENHWVMYYTGLYLAAQTWPNEDETTWFNGKTSAENFEEARGWLSQWFDISSTIGQGEFDSPTYITTFLTPMMVLYEFAKDSVMKTKAQLMLDLLFVDFAAEHLAGNYGGGHSRDYPEDIINPLAAPSTFWAWLYFGQPEMPPWNETRYRPRHRSAWEPVYGAASSYRLPEIIYHIATDRSKPYIHTETKRVRNIIRFGKEKNPPVYKYSYVTKHYILGSLHGGILQPIQQHTWDVTYVSDKPNNTIFTLHPFYSGKELAMFFPEEQKFLSDEVDRYHKVYTNPNKWNSSSPYEQTLQHKNALIVLYDIEEGTTHPHIDGFFPKTLDERVVDDSGWIFARSGATFVGIFPLKSYEWKEEDVNWRLRSFERRNGFVVEVGSSDEDGSFENFRLTLTKLRPVAREEGKQWQVEYRTREGTKLQHTFNGQRIIDGKQVDFKRYKFFNGPYVQSERGSGVITLTHGGKKRVLDFKHVKISETP
jgi:hypothetical protein